MIRHTKTRPCVVFDDLPPDMDGLRPRLKRDIRESVRRSRNRSAKLGGVTFRVVRCGGNRSGSADIWCDCIECGEHAGQSGTRRRPRRNGELVPRRGRKKSRGARPGPGLPGGARGRPGRGATCAVRCLHRLACPSSGLNPRYWELSLNTMLVITRWSRRSRWTNGPEPLNRAGRRGKSMERDGNDGHSTTCDRANGPADHGGSIVLSRTPPLRSKHHRRVPGCIESGLNRASPRHFSTVSRIAGLT